MVLPDVLRILRQLSGTSPTHGALRGAMGPIFSMIQAAHPNGVGVTDIPPHTAPLQMIHGWIIATLVNLVIIEGGNDSQMTEMSSLLGVFFPSVSTIS